MKCVRNILLVCLLCAFICGPAFMYVAVKAKLPIPEWLDPESAMYLTGGRKNDIWMRCRLLQLCK